MMMRTKENVIRHQYISTTNIRDDISTQYIIVICICYIDVYMYVQGDCIRIGIEMVELYEVWESMSSMSQLSAFILQKLKISCIMIGLSFSFEHHDYNSTNIYTRYVQCLVLRTDQHTIQRITILQRKLVSAVAVSTINKDNNANAMTIFICILYITSVSMSILWIINHTISCI